MGERPVAIQPPIEAENPLSPTLFLEKKIALAIPKKEIPLGRGITVRLLIPDAFNATFLNGFNKYVARKFLGSGAIANGIDYNEYHVYDANGDDQGPLHIPSPFEVIPGNPATLGSDCNFEDLRDGTTITRRVGIEESVLGGTVVPPKHLQPTEGPIDYHPIIVRIHEDEDHNLVAGTPLVIKEIIGKNTTILRATEDSAVFLVREDPKDGSNKNAISIFGVKNKPDGYDLEKLGVLELPTIYGFNTKKSGTAGSLAKRNGKWLGFIHGQTDQTDEDDSKIIEYRLLLVDVDPDYKTLRVSNLMIDRAMLYPIAPEEVELRPEKRVVYSCDSVRFEGDKACTTISIGDILSAELTFPITVIDEALEKGKIYGIGGALKMLNGDKPTINQAEVVVFEPESEPTIIIPAA